MGPSRHTSGPQDDLCDSTLLGSHEAPFQGPPFTMVGKFASFEVAACIVGKEFFPTPAQTSSNTAPILHVASATASLCQIHCRLRSRSCSSHIGRRGPARRRHGRSYLPTLLSQMNRQNCQGCGHHDRLIPNRLPNERRANARAETYKVSSEYRQSFQSRS